jgi:helix-turn-helix, Psq domain.
MADDTDCDVASNGEVFDDVDSDPGSIINNVVQSCSKILIPSMAQPSISKLSSNDHDSEVADGIFQGIKSDDDVSDQNNDEVNIKPDLEGKRRLSVQSPRTVKWSFDIMAAAMDSVFGGELTTTNAARKYQIPRTTLLDRLSMKVRRQHLESSGSFPLNAESDAKVVEFVQANHHDLDKPTLIKGILQLGEQLARLQGRPFDGPLNSRKWLKLFVQKHPNLEIFSYSSRTRNATSRSSVSISGAHNHNNMRASSLSGENTVLIPPQILHIQQHDSLNHMQNEQNNEQNSPPLNTDNDNVFDSLESSLAKQGVKAIEQKLNTEQLSYFHYRNLNKSLERGFELWKLCKDKTEGGDNLSVIALGGVEQGLIQEHLKYFRFRYENPELEDGYNLWAVLREKIHD